MVIVAAYTAARIGDVSGCRAGDIDATQWIWTVRRRTTAAPGGLTDKGTKGQAGPPGSHRRGDPPTRRPAPPVHRPQARRPPVRRPAWRTHLHRRPARCHALGRRGHQARPRAPAPRALRHTGPTWFADAGAQVHVLRRIAGHGSLTTSRRCLHPDVHKITAAGAALSAHLSVVRTPRSLPGPIVMTL